MSAVLPSHPVQFRGSAMARRLLGWLGWTVNFQGLPAAQGVIVVYPHTSNWDFPVGLLAKWAMGLQVNFWAKHSLFRIPLLGSWMRWLGGVPVNRRDAAGFVAQAVASMRQSQSQGDYLWVVIAPEGTRSWKPAWRSGFYRLALSAQVPLGLALLDYGRKQIHLTEFIELSGDVSADMARIGSAFEGCTGCRPELAAPITIDYNGESS